ncbi:ubiquitin carboxyl-terminal hydrolase 29-like [Silurus meridionalis]|uniref:ubiquitin carboxyl-terminal hydrolase 29-like n=1 Tax=Silurus meridionalis TaxID=175797 RepID=UPI001EEAE848|nr:ubiquitin carboxyl-terminal hydrolase 29-like [Silurus meridionalis]
MKSQTTSGGNMMISTNMSDCKQISFGLPNFGNTCYINSSLQFLLTAEAFCKELSNLMDNCMDRPQAKFLRCFVNLWRMRNNLDVQGQIHKDNLLMDLINEFIGLNPSFAISDRNSALTFLCQCLKQMEEAGQMMGWKNNSTPIYPVGSNFKITMKKVTTCSRCGFQQNILKEMNYISLPLVHNSVDQCLSSIVNNRQPLQDKCQMCQKQTVNYYWTFHSLPKFLILYLQREALNKNSKLIKLNNPVAIQPQLKINTRTQSCNGHMYQQSVYLLSLSQIYKPQKENSKAEARNKGNNKPGESKSTYRLISVINYIGRKANDGHFLTDCFTKNPPQWWTCNDEFITLTTEKEVVQKRLLNAYLLLYERVNSGRSSFSSVGS